MEAMRMRWRWAAFAIGLCVAGAIGCGDDGAGVEQCTGETCVGAPITGASAGMAAGSVAGMIAAGAGGVGAGTSGAGASGGAAGVSSAGMGGAGAGGVEGSAGAGAGGTTVAGMGGTGGMAAGGAGGGDPMRSSGCGSTSASDGGPQTIDVDGTPRDYILALPDGYDANHAYPLIFGWHPRGGSAESVAGGGFIGGYYGLEDLANGSAIFVAPDGIDAGWANTGGRDIAFLQAMLERLKSEMCIDESRIFSAGFSYGGMMSFAIGCAMGDVFRAIAPMSGALYSGCEDGSASIAVWGSHGAMDDVVPLDDGEAGLQVFLERNHCGTETVATDPSPCVSYQGCDAGYPVTWCEFQGGHMPPQFAAEAIWEFFSQF